MRSAGPYVLGKIIEAYRVASEYPEEVEADLQRYYGLDFVDLWRPGSGLTWRKLLVLLHHLPSEGALNTAMRNDMPEVELSRSEPPDPTKGRWSAIETLLAVLIDEVRQGNWLYVQAHSEQRVPRPEPIRRPGVSARNERRISLSDAQKIDPRLRGLGEKEAQEMLDRLTGRG